MGTLKVCLFGLLTSSFTLSCALESPEDESIAQARQPIIDGTPVIAEDIGLVKLLNPNGGGCSGTLLTPEWVLTAQHCLPQEAAGITVERTTTGDLREAVQIIPWSTSGFSTDIGLIRVSEPFPIAVDADGYTNTQWPFGVAELAGNTVECYGYGYNTPEGAGFGTLRHASLPIERYDVSSNRYYLRPNALGQIPYYGDSGSGCFTTREGKRYQLSVLSTVSLDLATVEATGGFVRDWIDLQVNSQCDDGVQSGTETGVDCGGSCAACPPVAVLTVHSQWDTGWCGQVVVTNHTSTTTSSWSVTLDVHDSSVSSPWGANFTSDGSLLTATNDPWGGFLQAGQSRNFGMCATKTGPNWQPEIVSAQIQ